MSNLLRITFTPIEPGKLPFSYREEIQGLIYRLLPEELSRWLHDEGLPTAHGHWKPFVFSRLYGKLHPDTSTKTFFISGPLELKVASPKQEIIEQIALALLRKRQLRLASLPLETAEVRLERIEPPRKRSVVLVARSPITVFVKKGRRRHYFAAPEPEFAKRIATNLRAKALALGLAREIAEALVKIEPLDKAPHNKKVERFKQLIIEGWMGRYRLEGPPELAWVALTSGLGALGSQGFGFVEVVGGTRTGPDRQGGDRR